MTTKKCNSSGSCERPRKKSSPTPASSNLATFKPSTTMKLIPAAKLVDLQVSKRFDHWGNRIQSNQTGMMFGPRGYGKTFCSLGLAIGISSGAKFLGLKPKKPRRVIYLDGEMDMVSMQDRIKKISASLGVDVPENLSIFTPEAFANLLPSISEAAGLAQIDALISTNWDVLVIDNYSAWSGSGREDADVWAPVMRWLLKHKRAGKTVLIVHHTNKSGGQRGSSRHEDALDFSISLQPFDVQNNDGALRFNLIWTKCRHLNRAQASPISVTMKSAADGAITWHFQEGVARDPRIANARKLKKSGETNVAIAEALGVDRTTVGRWLKGTTP